MFTEGVLENEYLFQDNVNKITCPNYADLARIKISQLLFFFFQITGCHL